MATVATFTVPSHEFPLGTVFDELPGAEITLERFVPGPDVIIPYFWVRGVLTDDIEAAFSDHPGVRQLRFIDSIEDEYLLRVEWEPSHMGLLTSLANLDIPLLEAIGTNEQWTFEIRADTRGDIAEFQRLCRERGIPITLTSLHALTPLETATESALTDAQEEVLVLAFERGYFNSPRDVTMEELGEELEITQQAVASRLRRGIRNILNNTLSAVHSQ